MTGIIVGRFQVPELTKGHIGLIESALWACNEVIVFIGDTKDGRIDSHDPLPYSIRAEMVKDSFPDKPIKIFRFEDIGNFPKWVEELDKTIDLFIKTGIIKDPEVRLYGSRDSFIWGYKEYLGKYETWHIEEVGNQISGTVSRQKSYKEGALNSLDFRKGIIWALMERDKYLEKIEEQKENGTRD